MRVIGLASMEEGEVSIERPGLPDVTEEAASYAGGSRGNVTVSATVQTSEFPVAKYTGLFQAYGSISATFRLEER